MGSMGPKGPAGIDGETGETGPTGGKGSIVSKIIFLRFVTVFTERSITLFGNFMKLQGIFASAEFQN